MSYSFTSKRMPNGEYRFKHRRVFPDSYRPRRWFQRAAAHRRGWVLKVPGGSLWFLVLPHWGDDGNTTWVHSK